MGNSAQQPHPDNGALETLAPITLHCGAWQARVAPQYGMNMLSLTYLGQELLRTPASAADFSAAPETFGTPPLMPASRTADATFVFDGKRCELPMNEPQRSTHKHGRLHCTEFTVQEQANDAVVGVYRNTGDIYPFPFTATIGCTLSSDGCTQTYAFRNDGDGPMPVIFAIHAAFVEPTWCRLPIGEAWELDERFLPTGSMRALSAEESALLTGAAPPTGPISSCFTAIGRRAELGDFYYEVSPLFTQWVVWNGGGVRGFLCVEPQSGPINALNIEGGAIRVAAGETVRFTTRIGKRGETACNP